MVLPVNMAAYPDDGTPSSAGDGQPGATELIASEQRAIVPEQSVLAREPARHTSLSEAPPLDTERFVPGKVIGRGASGVVIRAFDSDICREVAIKILDPELGRDSSTFDRFAEEARITGQLEHPNIVPVYELSFDRRGHRFLAMKLIKGDTLQATIDRLGASRLESARLGELLQVFVKVCDAVSFAHNRGVIHRDLKPTNIMVSDFGQVYVLDWGIARLREPQFGPEGTPVLQVLRMGEGRGPLDPDPPGLLLGTVGYMAPEQIQGLHDRVDQRTDVFALGATLYQILTGQVPLPAEVGRAIRLRKVPPPLLPPDQVVSGARVPPELSRIAMRAMAYDPADRYGSVEELKHAVGSFQRGAWDLPRTLVPAGSRIIAEGEPGNAAFVILEGQCLVYYVDDGEENAVRVMGPGEVFGETAVFTDKPRTASVKALTDTVLITVTREVLANALGLNSWMGAFIKALADRFRQADEKLRAYERAGRSPPSRP